MIHDLWVTVVVIWALSVVVIGVLVIRKWRRKRQAFQRWGLR